MHLTGLGTARRGWARAGLEHGTAWQGLARRGGAKAKQRRAVTALLTWTAGQHWPHDPDRLGLQ